jgi:RHS repeat-associated protein
MPGRNYNTGDYRYGFQGQEKDDEIKGTGNSINYKYRVHVPRLGRFLSLDPLAREYPYNSPYAFSENRVIDCIELEGLEWVSQFRTMFRWSGISKVDEQQVVQQVREGMVYASRLSTDAFIVTGGALVIAGSGGTATLVLGGIAFGGGITKFCFDAQGDYSSSDKVPTTASGIVMTTVNYTIGDELFSEEVFSTVEVVEGIATLNFKGLTNLSKIDDNDKVREAVSTMNVMVSMQNVPENLRRIFSRGNVNVGGDYEQPIAPADNTRVSAPTLPLTEQEARSN